MGAPLGPDPALIALIGKFGLPLAAKPCYEGMISQIAAEVKRLGWPAHWPTEPRPMLNHGGMLSAEAERKRKQRLSLWEMTHEGKERIRAAQVKRWEMHRERLEAG